MTRRTTHCRNDARDVEQTNRLIRTLGPDHRLAQKLARCGTLSHGLVGWQYLCRSPACGACRARHARAQARRVREFMVGATHEHAGLMTLVLEPVADLAAVEKVVTTARRAIKNFVTSKRRRDPRWATFSLYGWVEVDALDAGHLPLIGSRRSELLLQLGVPAADGPLWITTVHALVRYDELSAAEMSAALSTRWRAVGQAHVAPMHTHLQMEQNADNLVRYALKHRCSTTIDGLAWPWPDK